MIVRFAPEALGAIREKRSWWESHRDKAELIWRLLMPKTRTHVYYRVDDSGNVDVVTVWNAQGASAPSFSP